MQQNGLGMVVPRMSHRHTLSPCACRCLLQEAVPDLAGSLFQRQPLFNPVSLHVFFFYHSRYLQASGQRSHEICIFP